ncbi:MAG: RluA family pseudouridine synthase [Planctomycetes bacterium]|nr:RluA family pseudouridine synthase [Planctomycetota bacterium]
MTKEFHAEARARGERIEKFLARKMPGAAWSHVGKLLRQGRVRVGERVARRGETLAGGETVRVEPAALPPSAPSPNSRIRLAVVHEDAWIAVVAKPSRLPMQPGPGHGTDTLLHAALARFPETASLGEEHGYGLVHRLDRETSGLVVVARTAEAYDRLAAAFAAREVEKEYRALVLGRPEPGEGLLSAPVEGKAAVTRYRVFETRGAVSLIAALPETGRTHQIRIHLAGIGHPVLADSRHGRGLDGLTARLRLARLALHAARIGFVHPGTGERVEFEAPMPRDLRRAWKKAGKSCAQEPEA